MIAAPGTARSSSTHIGSRALDMETSLARDVWQSAQVANSLRELHFDWADETLHASYGKRRLKELLAIRGQDPAAYEEVRNYVRTATPAEVAALKSAADVLLNKAKPLR